MGEGQRERENPGDLSGRAEQGAVPHTSSVSSHQLLPPRIVNCEERAQGGGE